ncbi:MAG: mannitol-1-phosphate 5-dehydrogenase [Armatimonadota bacterium]
MNESKFVQIGAGNIGRSFIGQLFARAGFDVTFIDVDPVIVNALNEQGRYRVQIKGPDPETIWVEGVRGVDGRDRENAARELADCRLCATAVGPGALKHVYPTIAMALEMRVENNEPPLDIIICENMRAAADAFRQGLSELVPDDFPLEENVGLIETSIGKMVPIMSAEDRARDPLLVFAEAYNTLICDRHGFKNEIPDVPGLEPKKNMKAYVDRKLFIHNLGHALCAYLGHVHDPSLTYTYETVEHDLLGPAIRAGMMESANALIGLYPDEFNTHNQAEHVEDLLQRFANRALGDTLYRVGRDVQRKLSREDRVIGALVYDLQHGVTPQVTALCAACGMRFRATDEAGKMYARDREFAREIWPQGLKHILSETCGLSARGAEKEACELIESADRRLHDLIICGHRGLQPVLE